jgi:hypothetical protein
MKNQTKVFGTLFKTEAPQDIKLPYGYKITDSDGKTIKTVEGYDSRWLASEALSIFCEQNFWQYGDIKIIDETADENFPTEEIANEEKLAIANLFGVKH